VNTSKQKVTRHAQSPLLDAYSLCHVTHEGDAPVTFAASGQSVNCPSCRIVINFCRSVRKGYAMPYNGEAPSFSPNWDERNSHR
jgi:hypothetical protein